LKHNDKKNILDLIIQKLKESIEISSQAVAMARDTATHKDCLGSSKYETMGLEASYLAQGQGIRLLELERSLAYFKRVDLQTYTYIRLETYIILTDVNTTHTYLWMAGDAGGLKIKHGQQSLTVITPQSPLGKALMGKTIGDDFSLSIMGKEAYFEVASVI